jgi:hypothetical protein
MPARMASGLVSGYRAAFAAEEGRAMPRIATVTVTALALAAAAPAAAQMPAKYVCTPDASTLCDKDNKCQTEPASAADKDEKLLLDFGTKKAETRRDGKVEPVGDIVDDKVEGEKRVFGIRVGGNPPLTMAVELVGGKMTGKMTNEGSTLTLAFDCAPAT